MIIFLVEFLKHSPKNRISFQGLELAVQDLFEEKNLPVEKAEEIKTILKTNPKLLVNEKCKYFGEIKPYLLPFLV
ncbi:hypothetical protein J4477_03165 [Candidatus Pacearchaeota archaeon]|nr:hypothetical protein [uncultured archaeon]MBS3072806.1 hypothetical protein [Candidatus Pacearchaeota archaeon]